MHFHESLPACIAVLQEVGVSIDINTLIVRDGVGRLSAVRDNFPGTARVETLLKERLQGYAASPAVISGALARRLIADPDARVVETIVNNSILTLRFIDRRLSGADWLAGPRATERTGPTRIVFASIKGGVGRSTALSVLAAKLAGSGKRVLAVDLDLEAPGIGFMLLPVGGEGKEDRRPKYGVVDYLIENSISSAPDDELIDYVGTSSFSDGSIDVIPATGRVTDEHPAELIQKLARAFIEDVQIDSVVPLWMQLRRMLERFETRKHYDVVLLDARAGLAEITAAPLLTLGAHVFFFATDQEQTFRGYRYLLSYMSTQTDYSRLGTSPDWRQRLTFVQAKAPASERRRSGFRERVYDLCSEWLYEEGESDGNNDNALTFSPSERGVDVPHDCTYIRYDGAYDAFDPSYNGDQLDAEVFNGPFGAFLKRADEVLGELEEKVDP